MSAGSLLEYALYYASLGWPVLPLWWPKDGLCACRLGKDCGSAGKHPLHALVPNGSKDATVEAGVIEGWWRAWPLANVGVTAGTDRMMVDVDAYKGGKEGLEALEDKWGRLPYSLRAASGSGNGSMHIHLALPEGATVRNSAGVKLGQGLDVRGVGGYVVAPPSLHRSGGNYVWLDEGESNLEVAPDWLVKLCQTAAVPEGAIGFNPEVVLSEKTAERVAGWLLPQAAVKVDGGMSRHDAWVWFVTQCSDNRVPLEVATSYRDMWLGLCREVGRERVLAYGELDRALTWAYRPEGPRRPPLDAVRDLLVREEEERTGKVAPEVVFGTGPPAKRVLKPDQVEQGNGRKRVEWLSLGQAARKQKNVSKRYRTGFPTIDALARGGIPMAKIVLVVGRPGSGKTGWALQAATNMYREADDLCVGLYMADEGLGPAVIRMAQREGFDRGALESAEPEVLEAAALALDKIDRVFCMDPDSPGASLEAFIEGMVERAAGRPMVWVIDSAQVVRCENAKDKDRRVTTAMVSEFTKAEGRRLGAATLLLSQSNRAAWKSKRAADNADPLSAGSESGALEHMADMVLYLVPEGDEGRVQCQMPKNRIGGRVRLAPIWLDWDIQTATFTELDDLAVSKEIETVQAEKESSKAWASAKKVLAALKKVPGGMTTRNIGTKVGMSNAKLADILGMLEEKGLVSSTENPGRGGGLLWKKGASDGTEE